MDREVRRNKGMGREATLQLFVPTPVAAAVVVLFIPDFFIIIIVRNKGTMKTSKNRGKNTTKKPVKTCATNKQTEQGGQNRRSSILCTLNPFSPITRFYPNMTTLRSGLCCRNSVCLSSVTLVHPTQGVEALVKISSPLCTLAIL